MLHSTVTSKGQTTIPGPVRKALNIRPGDRLMYSVEGDSVSIRVHPGASAFRGALRSDKGKGLSFAQIRKIAERNMADEYKDRYKKWPDA